jgi:DNA (cytosine-5)-methyltransferase 1
VIDLDTFAGPGGWDEGMRLLGQPSPLGFEWDDAACRTARAAGHRRATGPDGKGMDVTTVDLAPYMGRVRGLINSPTCRSFSNAGTGGGEWDRGNVCALVDAFAAGKPAPWLLWNDERSALTAEPMRWIHTLRPEWIAMEQVPQVMPLWEHYARHLQRMGYFVDCGVLRAEDYGVPQARRRGLLIASRVRAVRLPSPTHLTPVTMGEALGIDDCRVLVSNYGSNGDPAKRGRRRLDQLAPTMTGKCGRNRWEWPDGTSRTMTVQEAAVLQGFRADYPWQGGSIQQQQQVGDAVPPPLAAAVLAEAIGVEMAVAA